MPKLKVFRAVSGFHDSYVAVPSRAAALRAWGANTDLFAMGAAEQVTDTKLMAKALAKPGVVFKRKRGASAAADGGALVERRKPKPAKPSRAILDKAEQRLAEAESAHAAELAEGEAAIRKLEESKRKLVSKQQREVKKLETARDKAAEAYSAALDRWKAP